MATSGQDSISFLEQGAIQSLDQAIDKMRQLVDLIDKSANASKILNAAMTGNQGGSVAKTVQDMDELAKMNVKVADLTRKIAAAQSDYNVILQAHKNILRDVNKEANDKAKIQSAEAGSYNEMSASLDRMTRQYKAMGEAQRTAVGGDLVKRIQETDAALKKLDASMGVHRRNVGNYQGAVFSLSQVIRELPAFTYSAQMGFMAIGNNMPILIDQFKLLKAEVGSTGKALAIFGRSIFSFVNVFTILSGLFTIFYKDIMNFINPTIEATKAQEKLAESMKSSEVQILGLKSAMKSAEEGVISKTSFTKEYNEVLGGVVGKAKDYATAIKNTNEYADQYLAFLYARNKQEESFNKVLELRKDLEDTPEFIENTNIWQKLKAKFSQADFALEDFISLLSLPTLAKKTQAFFGDTREQYAAYYKAKTDELETAKKAAEDAMVDYLNKSTPFNNDRTKKPKKKDINRIADLKAEMEKEQNMLDIQRVKENMSEFEFYEKSIRIRLDYSNKVESLGSKIKTFTKDELKDFYDFNAEMLTEYKKTVDDVNKILPKRELSRLRNVDLPDDKEFDFKESRERTLRMLQGLNKKIQDDQARTIEQLEREAQQLKETYVDIARSAGDFIMNIQDGLNDREMLVFDQRERRLKDYYDNELRFIEQSGMATEEKEKAKQELEAVTEAKRKKIDFDRTTALRKQAVQNKALTVASVTLETTLAVMAALSNKATLLQSLRFANAIAVGLAGAAQIAKALATPLPQYAKGRGKGKAEWAEVGEAGLEVIARGSGKVEVVDRPTITHLAPDDQVFNKDQIVKAVQSAAYVKLSQHSTVTTDKLQTALLQAFEDNTHELRQVKQIIADKKFTATVTQLSQYEAYKNQNIR